MSAAHLLDFRHVATLWARSQRLPPRRLSAARPVPPRCALAARRTAAASSPWLQVFSADAQLLDFVVTLAAVSFVAYASH